MARGTIPRCRQYVSALDLGGETTARTSQWQPERCNGSARSGTKAEIWRALLRCETAERTPATLLHSCTGAAGWPVTCTQRGRGKRKARYDVGGTWHKPEAEPGRLGLPTFDLDSIILSSPLFLLSPS
ncbi:uncharacterized protein CLUP02_00749 [Colletotrichum lupini]|uniref:Uncharacterized protein n=1 Tax=Colletotrichum lupini TaxID=145971 RepID=A0A9Q8SCP2_9PEZI|nr:uncharacterized protein CLUP02_00749 [Colletotrichum lupini]UQC74102.1 hypothetical protein CLUP02_00749 [Colletotrichum lupini]